MDTGQAILAYIILAIDSDVIHTTKQVYWKLCAIALFYVTFNLYVKYSPYVRSHREFVFVLTIDITVIQYTFTQVIAKKPSSISYFVGPSDSTRRVN